MFYTANAFNQDIGGWSVKNVTDMTGMLLKTPQFNHYEDMLKRWSVLPLQSNVILDVDVSIQVTKGSNVARKRIINDFGWTINDGSVTQ